MNVFHKITRKNLKKNRVRTLVTIIGVILSTAMITAVFSIGSSFVNFMKEGTIEALGDWYAADNQLSQDQLQELQQREEVSEIAYAKKLGYAERPQAEANQDKPYYYVLAVSEGFAQQMRLNLTQGRMPQNEHEILIPEHLLDQGGYRYALGEEFTLTLGDRAGGLSQYNPYSAEEESFIEREQQSYVVTGFYQRPSFEEYSAPGYTLLTALEAQTEGSYEAYFKTKDPDRIYSLLTEMQIGTTKNESLLAYMGSFQYNNWAVAIYGVVLIILGLILVASVALIYNAFALSVSERTQQFGLLSSIGATWRQLRASVLYEAAIVSCIGIPLGIISGLIGIGITLHCLEGAIQAWMRTKASMSLAVSWPVLLLAAAIAIVTVFISAWIPARRAKRITAMEAIRKNQDVKVGKRERRSGRWMQKWFGANGLLARRYFGRSRKKYRITTFSLALSVVLLVASSCVCSYVLQDVQGAMESYEEDIQLSVYDEAFPLLDETLRGLDGVESVSYAAVLYEQLEGAETQQIKFYLLDDATYERYVQEQGLDLQKLQGKGILYDQQVVRENHQYRWKQLLDPQAKSMRLQSGKEYEIGARVEEPPMGVSGIDYFAIMVYPYSEKEALELEPGSAGMEYYLKTGEAHSQVMQEIQDLRGEAWPQDYDLYDFWQMRRVSRSTVTIIRVFSYGFVALIALIAAANVFNSISTNLLLRRKEFAVLRSLGMSHKGLWKMMNEESLLYGGRALAWGLAVSLLLSRVLYELLNQAFDGPYQLPLEAMAVSAIGVFAVLMAAMFYAGRKLQKGQIMEALRENE
ncbi:MAG: FtsX-like permease family protein [Lachnospiraceae bacterium]|jgi:putative ABC transport system permease protein|nr:FtsX-like permease family protein [Lachnospiraceae bacterium]